MKRPLVVLTIAFAAGIFLGRQIYVPFIWLYLAAVFLLAIVLILPKNEFTHAVFIIMLVFALGWVLYINQRILGPSHISKFVYYRSAQPCFIKGYVCQEPLPDEAQKIKFIFQAEKIQTGEVCYKCRGYVLVYVKSKTNLHYGEELILRGKLSRPLRWQSSRRMSYRDYLYNQGIYALIYVQTPGDLLKLNSSKGSIFKKLALRIRSRIESLVLKHVSALTGSIMNAMILGDKRDIPAFIYNSMVNTGTVHILVVSGFNVGLVAFVASLFLKLIRVPRSMRFYLVLPIIIFYCLIVGASTPVLRATLMAIIFLFAFLIQREADIYNACAFSALVILIISPNQLFDIGFQLSFVSVISIVYLYPKIKSFFKVDKLRSKPLQYIVDSILVSLAAWLGTAGFIAYYFKIFSPVTALANLIVVPLASLITLTGFVLVTTALIFPPWAYPFACASELAISAMLKVNLFLANLAFSHFNLP